MIQCTSYFACPLGAMLCLAMMGICYQYGVTKLDNYRYPAPGTLTDVGGYKLHSYCTGSGKPTVILDAGMGGDSTWWRLVQQDVSTFTRVMSYDRAGYGWSDASPEPRTSAIIVKELHTLLHNQGIEPPYILVGHSFGGTNMKLYANTYPDEVYALILVDACYEKQWEKFVAYDRENPPVPKTVWDSINEYWWHMINSKPAHYMGITRLFMPSMMKPFFAGVMPKDLQQVIIAKASALKSLETFESEQHHCAESFDQSANASNFMINKPLIVISHGKKEDQRSDAIWPECQKALLNDSTQSQHIVAHKSGHMINVEQPEVIVEAIRALVEQYNNANSI